MNQTTVALAYCIDNHQIAEKIDQTLAKTRNYRVEHYYGKKKTSDPSLNQQLENEENLILLIISDNFLKSAQCMNDSLDLLQQKGDQILPIITPGIKRDPDTGEVLTVETNFQRVSDIIQYINYWQDQYLNLRRQKRQLELEMDSAELNSHLKIMREISSEAGEFLRLLRNMEHVSMAEFEADDFKYFFEYMEDEESWKVLSEGGIIETAQSEVTSIEEADENIDIQSIPGLDLLEQKDNIVKIIETRVDKKDDINIVVEEQIESPLDLNEVQPTELEVESTATEEYHADQQELANLFEETVAESTSEQEEGTQEEEPDYAEASSGEEEKTEELVPLIMEIETEEEPSEVFEEPEVDAEQEEPNYAEASSGEEEEDDEYGYEEDDEDYDDEEDDDDDEEEEQEPLPSIRGLLTEAMQLIDNGEIGKSLQLLEDGVAKHPESNELRYRYALLLAQDGSNIDNAIEQLDTILRTHPSNEEANFLRGELSEMSGDFQAARRFYERVATSNSDHLDVYYRLGIVLSTHFENEYNQAARYFKKASRNNPSNVDALYQYALLQTERLGKPKKAIKYFKKALIENPGHPFANYDLALVYHQLGNKAKAWSAYQAAIAINPELKTPENDLVFTKPEPKVVKPKPVVTNEPVLGAVAEEVESEIDTIAALKNNIQQLEQLLTARLQEKEKPEPEVVETIIDPASIKTVFITGATSGIGKATAIEFAKNGHRLIINGRRVERLDAFKAELEESYNIEVLTLPFDVRDMEAVNGAVDSLEGVWGEIDILLNNAGKAKGLAPIHEGEMVHWEEMIDTNLKGILYLTRAVAPMMTTRHKGHIINISSSAGKEVYPNGNVYCATKHAVEALTKAMRIDLHKHNIRVSQVSPGHVEETEFALVRFDGDAEKAKIYNDFNPLTSKDVAEAIYFIATRPAHVNIQDVVMFGTQQASATIVDRSGRYEEEE